jgi:alpha-galactosidase
VPYLLCVSFVAGLNYTIWAMNPDSRTVQTGLPTAIALRLTDKPDADGFPDKSSWQKAPSVRFDQDWRGQNADAGRATEVRLLWTPQMLFLRFHASYRTLNVFPGAREDGWRDQLWDRDVAEAFLQPDFTDPLKYKEFEVAPNGFWIDLEISHGARAELHSKLRRRVVRDAAEKTWTAELAIPMHSLTPTFDSNHVWRANFYRVEGTSEPRFYSAWSATYSPEPDFHVPASFGRLVFKQAY